MIYYTNYNLSSKNSFKLKSNANEIWFPYNTEELSKLTSKLNNYTIMGGFTNVLLKPNVNNIINLKFFNKVSFANNNQIKVMAHVPLSRLINITKKYNLHGIEPLIGIPGTIGGAITMNSGRKGCSISDYLKKVTVLNTQSQQLQTLKKNDLKFKRRYSIIQDKNLILLSGTFQFPNNFNKKAYIKTLNERKIFPKKPSAGGIFNNWHKLKPHKDRLIGLTVGGAKISNQINIIVNENNATFNDIMLLIKKIQTIVTDKLELEVKIIK